jgi:hypothetical protein
MTDGKDTWQLPAGLEDHAVCAADLLADARTEPTREERLKLTIEERWEQGVDHHPKSVALYEAIAKIDREDNDDSMCWTRGGDGDNGESLMYLLDVYFDRLGE